MIALTADQEHFLKQVNSWKFKFFTFIKLPAAFFSGVRVKELNKEYCTVTVPYKWFSQNPFNSTYFACLAMAGEMSTGLPALLAIYKQQPAVSMLVVKLEAEYSKKATDISTFTCHDVQKIFDVVEQCKKTTEGVTVETLTIGKDKAGDEVARFRIVWSFRQKKSK